MENRLILVCRLKSRFNHEFGRQCCADLAEGETEKAPEGRIAAVVQLAVPFARQELHNLFLAVDEFGSIAPPAIDRIRQRNTLRITRIPAILRPTNFSDGRRAREGRR
jgi:hypothetical protein